jgi:hypothetical protein
MASIIPVQINSITARSPINKTFSGDLDEQIIPQSPDYFAGFAAYITLGFITIKGFKMKYLFGLFAFIYSAFAIAQINPITEKDEITSELSRTVSVGWSKNTWSNFQLSRSPISLVRTPEGAQILRGGGTALAFDMSTFFQYQGAGLPQFVEKKSNREDKPLTVGQTWKAEVTNVGQPAAWCSSTNNTKFDSKFEVEATEKYTLKINDVETTIEVLPVQEKGYWIRCYSAKRLVRSLYSKDLDAVVSLEFISYNTTGQVHESSFRYNMKEIKRMP